MSLQEIKIGNFANDGTGDDLREAFRKVNLNFQELDLRNDESTTAVNLGTAGVGVFSRRAGYELQFKKLVAGRDITLSDEEDRILVEANGGVKSLLVVSDSGSVFLDETAALNVIGTNGIETSILDNTLTVDFVGPVNIVTDTTPQLGGNLDAQGYGISALGNVDVSQGELTGQVRATIVDDTQSVIIDPTTGVVNLENTTIGSLKDVDDTKPLTGYILKWGGTKWTPTPDSSDAYNFDFNGIVTVVTSISEFIAVQTEVDMGSFVTPNSIGIDMGRI